jgi:class 3 adenylate cyclase/predicted ATPase/ABC-type transport system involved in cytochrome c biogenesis ATPase subunit
MIYRFGDCVLDEERYELRRAGAVVALEPKVLQVLLYLIQHQDCVVTRDELLEHCWPGTFVSESALTQCLARVRKAVGDHRGAPLMIKTVHGQGYRFVAPLWTTSSQLPQPSEAQQAPPNLHTSQVGSPLAEHRSLTVLCAEFVDVAPLADHLDAEELHAIVQASHTTCTEVIHGFEGYIAHYLSDGLVAYFGHPQAHEDDVQRSIRAGLRVVQTLQNRQMASAERPHTVRIGIHTGPVVVGAIGGGRHDPLAVGETLTIAARLKELAAPGMVVISATTARLVEGYFLWQEKVVPPLPGGDQDRMAYDVLGESEARSRLDIVVKQRRLTPFVGREAELAVLRERWEQVKEGMGQVVLLHGESGIGKSRLVQMLTEQIAGEPHTHFECRCSPYHQHSAWYPVTDLLTRTLALDRCATSDDKLRKLEQALSQTHLTLAETVPLLAALLLLPLPAEHYPSLPLSPQQQRRQTLAALLAFFMAYTAQQPLLLIVEDAQWIDPSTLELLSLLIDQGPTTRLLTCVTCRPEFRSPWGVRAHVTPIVLNRLSRHQVADMIGRMIGGKPLPSEVVQQLLAKTDGVPLFVEELTKMVLESGLLKESRGRYELTGPLLALAIPTTLHDSLMARVDRLGTARGLVQLGAVLGRRFAFEILQAVARLEEEIVQRELSKAVEAELLYQQGLPPRATYIFKHDLIRETAYQALLKRTRQQYHQRTAQVLAERFPEMAATQPELVAHHYTEAGLAAPAVEYWQRAGLRAIEHSANPEAAQHLTKGLELLATLPETQARAQQELDLQLALGPALAATKSWATPEVEQLYARARVLCQQVGETPQLFPALRGLCWFYINRGALPTARELGEQLVARLGQHTAAPMLHLAAHAVLGSTLFHQGEYANAWTHLEQCIALADPTAQWALAFRQGDAPGVGGLAHAAPTLWCLGYPAQARRWSQATLALAQTLAHPYSLAVTQFWAAYLHHRYREVPAVQAQAEALLTLATAQGFSLYVGYAIWLRGWALAMQGQGEAGLAQMHRGLTAVLATGQMLAQPRCLVLLAEATGHTGQVAEGLRLLAEALTALEASGQGDLLAEAYRLQGDLLLRQALPDVTQAEACFQEALAVARRQQAKSWELRAALSLSRLWQRQGKRTAARELLAPVYGWFTEGFDTADLREARALLAVLACTK